MKAVLVYENRKGEQKNIYLPMDFPYGLMPNYISTEKLIFEVKYTELRIDTMTYYIYADKVR